MKTHYQTLKKKNFVLRVGQDVQALRHVPEEKQKIKK